MHGNCVDLPNVPEGETFKAKVKLQAYPVVEAGDLLWAYMGPADTKPPMPGFDWLGLPSTHRYVKKFQLECNYLQAMEGDYDASHASFCTAPSTRGRPTTRRCRRAAGASSSRTACSLCLAGGHSLGLDDGLVAKRADGRLQYAAGPWMMPIFCTADRWPWHLLQQHAHPHRRREPDVLPAALEL